MLYLYDSKSITMKNLYFIFCFSFLGFWMQAQNQEIFDTWYLYKIQPSWQPDILIADYQPGISPTLTINEDFTYQGFMACNSFFGNFHFLDDDLFFDEFNSTDNSCETEDLNDFEIYYAYLFLGEEHFPMWFYQNNQTGELELIFGSNSTDQITYYFSKSPILGLDDIEINSFKVYPNPALDVIRIENAKPNSTYQIYSVNGEIVLSGQLNLQGIIDLKMLPSGNYFLQMDKQTTKFIKK